MGNQGRKSGKKAAPRRVADPREDESSLLAFARAGFSEDHSRDSADERIKEPLFMEKGVVAGKPAPRRKRVFSMDSGLPPKLRTQSSETLVGAIVMVLKTLHSASEKEICRRIEPIFGLLKKNRQGTIFESDPVRCVEGCLAGFQDKLFQFNEASKKWSLHENSDFGNYFSSLELRLVREKKGRPSEGRLRRRDLAEYEDVMEKLRLCLKCLSKNEKLARLVRKNPFKKIRKLRRTAGQEAHRFEEEILAEMLSSDAGGREERVIGILQAFHYFLPLLKGASEASRRLPSGLARVMRDFLRQALPSNSGKSIP